MKAKKQLLQSGKAKVTERLETEAENVQSIKYYTQYTYTMALDSLGSDRIEWDCMIAFTFV